MSKTKVYMFSEISMLPAIIFLLGVRCDAPFIGWGLIWLAHKAKVRLDLADFLDMYWCLDKE